MKDLIEQVRAFHDSFELPYEQRPSLPESREAYQLRHRLMAEENDEYLEACEKGDLTGIADALGDQLYVLLGTVITHGLQDHIVEVFEEIHRSNLSKLDEDGRPLRRADGKVLKSERFFRPDIDRILKNKDI